MEEFKFRDGMEIMDFPKVTQMLAKSFWSPGIKMDEVIKGASNSALVVVAFDNAQNQIGYARVVSDKTRFAYIMDVYVDENFREKGKWLLKTKDAHGVYSKVGFKPISNPSSWMEIRNERPKR